MTMKASKKHAQFERSHYLPRIPGKFNQAAAGHRQRHFFILRIDTRQWMVYTGFKTAMCQDSFFKHIMIMPGPGLSLSI